MEKGSAEKMKKEVRKYPVGEIPELPDILGMLEKAFQKDDIIRSLTEPVEVGKQWSVSKNEEIRYGPDNHRASRDNFVLSAPEGKPAHGLNWNYDSYDDLVDILA